MNTMRAISQTRFGGPEVLALTRVAKPEPEPTEVLVRVHAAGVNPVDWKTRAGGGVATGQPILLGWDVSGVVEAVGHGVTRFSAGDEVFGMPRFPHEAGAYADYVAAPSRQFARKPTRLSHAEAAALPLAALTAWQALVDTAGVGPGTRVLIHAAAGGVGHLAVQIAKARGAYVLGTASAAKHDVLRQLGVDEPIDYRAQPFEAAATDVDVVLDLIGGETGERSVQTLKPGGLLIEVPSAVPDRARNAAAKRGVRVTSILVEPDHAALEQLAALVEADRLHVRVEQTFPLEQAAAAHALGEAGRTTGKLVLTTGA